MALSVLTIQATEGKSKEYGIWNSDTASFVFQDENEEYVYGVKDLMERDEQNADNEAYFKDQYGRFYDILIAGGKTPDEAKGLLATQPQFKGLV